MYSVEDPVFRQKEVLFPDYIPDHLPPPRKESQSNFISDKLCPEESCEYIEYFHYGPPGTGNVDPRIKSSLRPIEEIPYRAYTFEQMREIIQIRVEFAFQKGVIDEKAIDYLAEVVATSVSHILFDNKNF